MSPSRRPVATFLSRLLLAVTLPGGSAAVAHRAPERQEIVNAIGMRLVLIQTGSFLMGSKDGEPHERPVHRVTIDRPFYLGATEVTQAQWVAVMRRNPSHQKGSNLPVTQVSHLLCREFCRRLTLAERAIGKLPQDAEYRLPTEAEWEYACRAGSTTRYCFGDDESGLDGYAWFDTNSGGLMHDVGQKTPNAWGLYDMHGNVGEWCADLYRKYGGDAESEPPDKARKERRVVRGGGYEDNSAICRSTDRCPIPAEAWHHSLGFRVVRTVPKTKPKAEK